VKRNKKVDTVYTTRKVLHMHDRWPCKFGRVVKALALGASLERGMGSNPIACNVFYLLLHAEEVKGV
jgi:hypothetical protein